MRLLYSLLLLSCTGLPTRSYSPDFIIEQGSRFGNVEIEEVDLWLTGISLVGPLRRKVGQRGCTAHHSASLSTPPSVI